MIPDIDWKAEMAALDASLPERLERVALMADIATHYIGEMRVMPAAGVADIIWEALDEIRRHRGIDPRIEELEAALRKIGESAKSNAYGSAHIICHTCSDTHHAVEAALKGQGDE